MITVYHSEAGVKDGTSPGGSYGWKGGAALSRQYRVRWADRFLALRQLVGYSYAATEGGVRRLRRELPEPVPWDQTLHCVSARIVRGEKWTGRTVYDRTTRQVAGGYPNKNRVKDDDGLPTDALWKANEFKWAVLTADWAAADFYLYPDSEIDGTYQGSELARFVSYRDDRSASYVTFQGGTMYYIIPNVPADAPTRLVPFGVGRVEGKKSVYLKWHQVDVAAVPWATIDGLVGKVNKTTFVTHPAGTLLFLPPKVDRYVMPNGRIGCDVELVLDYFADGQNKLLRVVKNNPIKYLWVTSIQANNQEPTPGQLPAGEYLYDEADFHAAFDCNKP